MGQDPNRKGNKPNAGDTKSDVQGEGNYDAARRYDDKTRDFVKSHDVEQAGREAQPANRGEEREMQQAEEHGKSRAKEEDPLLKHPENIETETGKGGAGKPSR